MGLQPKSLKKVVSQHPLLADKGEGYFCPIRDAASDPISMTYKGEDPA